MIYHIKKGDTLGEIAKRYGVSVESIMFANPKIEDKDLIHAGDWIYIPVFTSWWQRLWKSVENFWAK